MKWTEKPRQHWSSIAEVVTLYEQKNLGRSSIAEVVTLYEQKNLGRSSIAEVVTLYEVDIKT